MLKKILPPLFFFGILSLTAGAQNFRVQVAALEQPAPSGYFKKSGLDDILQTVDAFGIFHYYAPATFRTREEAERLQAALAEKGFPRASILDLEAERLLSEVTCPYRTESAFRFFIQEDSLQRNLFFDSGSASLSPDSRLKLDGLARLLRKDKRARLDVYGFTDAQGKGIDNIELAATRARVARDYLIEMGKVEADRMNLKIFGEAFPTIMNQDFNENDLPENRRLNRRVVLRVVKQ